MKRRLKKSGQLYYVILNKSTDSMSIHSTGTSVAAYIGVNRTTLYKHFLNNDVYHKEEYSVWCNVPMYMCNKGLIENLYRQNE